MPRSPLQLVLLRISELGLTRLARQELPYELMTLRAGKIVMFKLRSIISVAAMPVRNSERQRKERTTLSVAETQREQWRTSERHSMNELVPVTTENSLRPPRLLFALGFHLKDFPLSVVFSSQRKEES